MYNFSYVNDPFVAVLQRQFPFIVLLSFIIIAPNICKDVVLEKERKLKVIYNNLFILTTQLYI